MIIALLSFPYDRGKKSGVCAYTPCTDNNIEAKDIIDDKAMEYLAERLSTPLQVEQHLSAALEAAYTAGIKPINTELLEETMSKRIGELEPTLIRHGYSSKVISDQFMFRTAEIRKLFRGELDANRAKEMTTELREAGLPI